MKLSTYTSGQVSPTTVSTPNMSLATDSNITGSSMKGLKAFSEAADVWAKAIKVRQQEEDQKAAYDAINEYKRQTYDAMYAEGDDEGNGVGFMHKQGSDAANVVGDYISSEKEIRDGILGSVKFHDKRNMLALQQKLDQHALGNYQTVDQHQYKQSVVAKQNTIANGLRAGQKRIQANYANKNVLLEEAGDVSEQIRSFFPNLGEEQLTAMTNKAVSDLVGSALDAASAAGDTNAVTNILEYGKEYLSPQQYVAYKKANQAKVDDNYMRSTIRKWREEEHLTTEQINERIRNMNTSKGGFEDFVNAIAGQESGGDYNVTNARTGAAGKYQIMPDNWPAWSREAGLPEGAEMTPENQEKVARFKLKQYYDKYGARGAAIAWYAGEGGLNYSEETLNRKQGNGDEPSINEYADQVLGRMGGGSPMDEGERDKWRNYNVTLEQQERHKENVAKIENFKYAKQYVYDNFINVEGGMRPIDDALKWAVDSAGGNLDKAEKNVEAVKDWYKIYGVNTTGGGKGPKLDNYDLDQLLYQGISQDELRHGLAERGYNATQVNQAIKRWQQHFERKGAFAVNKNDILNVVMGGKKSNFTPAELAMREGAWRWILEQAAKIEATENKGQPIEEWQMFELAEKAKENKAVGGGWFRNGRLVPYAFKTQLNVSKARFLGYKANQTGEDSWNVEYKDAAGDIVSTMMSGGQFADKVNSEWDNLFDNK